MPEFPTHTILESNSGARLAIHAFEPPEKPKAIVHINHGMSEHARRYARFANALKHSGYHAVSHDHRGHGLTRWKGGTQGQFAKTDGLSRVIADIHAVNSHIHSQFPQTPIIYFGHSMGSLLGLVYCIRHSGSIAGAALWNAAPVKPIDVTGLNVVLKLERFFKGSDAASTLIRKFTFDAWNRKFRPNRTQSDWLSRDEAEVDKYINDPLCGFDVTISLWLDIVETMRTGNDDGKLSQIRNDLPMHLLGGQSDPCSHYGKDVAKLAERLRSTGHTEVTCKLLPYTRHETLNELNRDDATTMFIAWLDEHFAR